ncbi:unnamed protein product [Caenorhabditis bovis]|uniref:Uncharacterized protein n=1 Tax=Caenorhabditis bovis TaxID=2654633 RepID=A0A8S1E4C8_9PELO|nr:unnamed protein product [Caenorhabditis bovis]
MIDFIRAEKCSSHRASVSRNDDKLPWNHNVQTTANDANLYLASNDDDELLKNVTIDDGLEKKSAYELKMNQEYGKPAIPFQLTLNIVTISTTGDASQLTGFLYFTTASQAKNPNFLVYIVDQPFTVNRSDNEKSIVESHLLKCAEYPVDQTLSEIL